MPPPAAAGQKAASRHKRVFPAVLALCLAATGQPPASASVIRPGEPGPYTGRVLGGRLYTQPDPRARGGIQGRIIEPDHAVMGVFALPQHDWRQVYFAPAGPERRFRFEGLPVARYDLLIVFDHAIYEGLQLHRGEHTLTPDDLRDIRERIAMSSGFFDLKDMLRCEGQTGRGGQARALIQEVRTRALDSRRAVHAEIQIRSIKLALLEQVGLGWSLAETREIARQEVGPDDHRNTLPAHYIPLLSGIRVLDGMRDIGDLNLSVTSLRHRHQQRIP